jgi:hypothetical protein
MALPYHPKAGEIVVNYDENRNGVVLMRASPVEPLTNAVVSLRAGGRFRASRSIQATSAVSWAAIGAFAHGFNVFARTFNRVASRNKQPA